MPIFFLFCCRFGVGLTEEDLGNSSSLLTGRRDFSFQWSCVDAKFGGRVLELGCPEWPDELGCLGWTCNREIFSGTCFDT